MDGRWIAVLIVLAYLGFLAAGNKFFHLPMFQILGVPALTEPFHDLRDIATGVERFRASEHPWSRESIIYSTQAYNYTKWWLGASYLGLNLHRVHLFAVALDALFFICALYVLGRLTRFEGCIAGLVLVSPNVMTAMERANADLVIFILMTLVLVLRRSAPLATAVVTVAALLKIYPVFALLGLAAPPWRKNLPWLLWSVFIVTVGLVTSWGEIHQIGTNLTRVGWFSYGSTTMMEGYMQTTLPTSHSTYEEMMLIGSFLFLMLVRWAVRNRPTIKIKPDAERDLTAFRIGAALYMGTFALGSNLDYRTILLIFCLPLLFVLRGQPGSAGLWAVTALYTIVFYLSWRFFLDDGIFLYFMLKQLTAWILVFLLAGIFASTTSWLPSSEETYPTE